MKAKPKQRRRPFRRLKGVPFLPSLLTLGNAFCGFLAIAWVVDASELFGQSMAKVPAGTTPVTPEILNMVMGACMLIFLAMFFDALDGKVARLTDQATDFGAQLDSLADAITFGATPAILGKFAFDVFFPSLPPKFSYICASLFALCAILRLARFNVETEGLDEESHVGFKGLPSPAAAAVIASLVLFSSTKLDPESAPLIAQYLPWVYDWVNVSIPIALVGCGLLMVSNLPYPHLINSVLKGKKSFPALAGAIFFLLMVPFAWHETLMAVCGLYLLSGPVLAIWVSLFGKPKSVIGVHDDYLDEDDSSPTDGSNPGPDDDNRGIVHGPGSRTGN
jgi:CDP-diacylglycerol--serine O-phosphatidyltransferase